MILKSWKSALLSLCVFVASISALGPTLVAQTGNVVISTNTTWPTGSYNLTSLSVVNGAMLTIGGGSTVTVSGAVLVTANSNVVLQSINNTSQVNGTWQGAGVTLNAGSVQVDSGSSINADGQGYVASAGSGGAPAGSSAGGSYGGLGGTGYGPTPASSIYGSNTMPTDLGSGGGSRCCGAIAGTGGGAIRLIVSGTLTDNGVISANGGNLVGYQGGGGAGGSVWVTTSALAGSGVFSATGGTGGEAGGGGGRLAVYYNAGASTYTGFSASTAAGGSCGTQCSNGTSSAGADGTTAFFDTSSTNSNLMVDQDFTIPANTSVSYNSITVQAGATLTIGGGATVTVANAFTVSGTVVAQAINNSAQVNGSWQGHGATIQAASVVVNTGGSINADGQGYIAGAGPGGAPNSSSAGGSYGGLGGVGDGVSPAGTYGSVTAPTDLGSGGNTRCCGTIPGGGGGAVTITVSGTLTDNGVISANGVSGTGLQVGGGSGGTVSIQTGTLTGSGSVTATGGSGGEAGGGGGRIAIYYNTNSGFNLTMITANGGSSSSGNPGAAGTVYTLGAGSNLTVSNNTTFPANVNLSFNNVTVNNGATLTLGSSTTLASNSFTVTGGSNFTAGGGSMLNVSGAVMVTGNSEMVLQSINNAAQVNGTWQGAGVTLNAGSVEVDSGSSINADGQGYVASAGPGGAPSGSSAGGSYGGLGGTGYGSPAAPIYGSDTMPTDLGSGGGSRCCGAIAGLGGGAVRLIVSGTLTDNGIISANGTNLVGYQGGGGSGGSVYVTATTLAGSGIFSATGGTGGEAAGGGGRIAVYYNAMASTYTGFSSSTAAGGGCGTQCSNGTSSAGGAGTTAFFDTSSTNGNLMVDQDFTIPADMTVSYSSITVQPGATLTIGGGSTVTVANSLTVSGTVVAQSVNNSAQVNGSWQGHGVIIQAASVVVNAGGSINADGTGYVPGAGPGGSPSGSSAGGSYGGLGGVGYGVSPAGTYGSTTTPTDLGSGGNTRCCGTIPGAGGGALTITVSGTLTDNGIISANGGNGTGLQVGGGSGGTVYIQTGTVTGSGSVAATGGAGGEAGGGGGRIALYYNTNNGFNATLVTSNGGASSNGNPGAVGTVYILGAGSNLTVSNNTTLPANASLSFSSVTVNNGGTLTVGSGTTLASNTVMVSGGGNFTVGGGSTVTVSGAVLVTANSNVVLQSINNASQVNGTWQGAGVTLNAGSVQVDSGSSINADGQGYVASAGPGGAPAGSSAGGSYGGIGGSGSGPTPAAPIYGSNTTPTDLGSGGGSRCCGAIAGPGGGAIRLIVSGTLTDNGVISANGANLVGYQGGGGSGGSVWVTTAGLAGSGVFTANGGTGGEAAGGGGRIAVYYNAPTSSFTGFQTSSSTGGSCGTQCSNGTSSAGAVGTVAFFDTSATNTNLMVDQDLTIPAGTTVTYNSITVQPSAALTIGGGSTVTVANSLTVSGTVVAQSINNSALVNNTWQGTGVIINAASVVVNPNGSINADGQGYVASSGPGGAPLNSSTGGSYGGPGGFGSGASTSPAIYGSTTAPTDLGSGGGYRCCGAIAGAGGGALTFNVSGSFTNNGVVSANGAAVVGYQAGGGSGGSVYVTTAMLTGSGAFTANGGVGGEAGGGGGRVAIYYDAPSSNFTGFAASTATGGACGVSAGSACANTASGGGNGTAAFFDTSATNNNLGIYQNFTIPAGTSPTYNTVTVQSGALLTIGGGATVTVTNALTVSGTVVAQSANNTAQVNGVWVGSGVAINAGSITVNATGSLNADTQGYVAGAGPGGSPNGSSAGGSYGGLGGVGNGVSPAGTYGSETAPTDLGSGGNTRCCGTIPGPGGGALLLTVSGTLTDNGVISANGGNGSGLQVGGGAGGSVNIHTATLAGSGGIAANGGSGGEAGGGGGRVALYFNTNSGFTLTLATATGGSSSSGNAGAVGTVYIPGPVSTASQTITFPAIPNHTFGDAPFTLGATASSGLAVTFAVTSGPATVSGNTVTIIGAGAVTIQATQAGNATYAAATPVSQSFTVSTASQTITFPAIPNHVATDAPFTVSATASSGLPVTFAVMSGSATISGNTVTLTGAGTVVIQASQAGNANYAAATSVSQSFTVSLATQTITFPAIPGHVYGDAPFTLGATASSRLTVSYTVTSGPATVSGNTVTLTGAGTVLIQASQAGDASYAAATPVSQSFVVLPGVTTLVSITPASGMLNAGATTITLTGSNFASTDLVELNGAVLASTFVNATTITAIIPASFFASAGMGQVTVVDSNGRTTTGQTFTVIMAPAINFSGPATTSSASQPTLTFQLVNPYPLPISGTLTLTFTASGTNGVDDPAVQFSSGGRTMTFTIPALSTVTPTVQIQTGTVAGTATISLVVTSNDVNVTPANVTPVQITIPPAVPTITTSAITRSGNTLSVSVDGFSNTRELSTAIFHFTAVPGSTISTPDITAPVGTLFGNYFSSSASTGYGSTFLYIQSFNLNNNDASSIQSVTVTLVNSQGDSMVATAQ